MVEPIVFEPHSAVYTLRGRSKIGALFEAQEGLSQRWCREGESNPLRVGIPVSWELRIAA